MKRRGIEVVGKRMEDEVIGSAIEYIKEIFAGDCSGHDYYHSMRVYRLAVQIAEEEKADLRIVALAALLHDVDDRKLSPETCADKRNAVDFMKRHGIDEAQIQAVCHIISEVSFAGTDSVIPDMIEGKCVQDADRLDAIGAIGIARTFAYGGSRGRILYDPAIKPQIGMSREEYQQNRESTSINHFYEKLLLLKDGMNTAAGRKLAVHRHELMETFLSEFTKEWNGDF